MGAMKHITALLTEREGYAKRGLTARVAVVDEELVRLGWLVETTAAEPVVEHAAIKRITKRKTN